MTFFIANAYWAALLPMHCIRRDFSYVLYFCTADVDESKMNEIKARTAKWL